MESLRKMAPPERTAESDIELLRQRLLLLEATLATLVGWLGPPKGVRGVAGRVLSASETQVLLETLRVSYDTTDKKPNENAT